VVRRSISCNTCFINQEAPERHRQKNPPETDGQ